MTGPGHTAVLPAWARERAARFTARFAEVFDAIAATAIERERHRELPHDLIGRLREAGFTRLTLPVERGGLGAGPAELFEVLAHLGQHDANVPQIFRSHFALIDRALTSDADPRRERILDLVADGTIFGNASHERGGAEVGSLETRLTGDGDDWRLSGTKYYSTGTLYADRVSVSAQDEAGRFAGVIVDTSAPGVERIDDWHGFGQRLTGSGTTVFADVPIEPLDIAWRQDRDGPTHDAAFLQLVLLACADGIGRAILSDAVTFVRERTRVYSHGSGATARHDPIVQETIGELAALSYQAGAAVRIAADAIDRSHAAQRDGRSDARDVARVAGEATTDAQLAVFPAVLRAASLLFEVGGASATDERRGFDRHWRNARTLASHNPLRYKARARGDALLNETPLAEWWSTGEARTEKTPEDNIPHA